MTDATSTIAISSVFSIMENPVCWSFGQEGKTRQNYLFFFFFKVFNTIIKFHLFLKKEVQIATS